MTHYPKPGPQGGVLIRKVIAALKEQGLPLPIASHILIGVSAGSDSTAVAHLLSKYGRRVAPVDRITLLHVNHGWRGVESDLDEAFVVEQAEKWGVKVEVHRLEDRPNQETQESWEDLARRARRQIFQSAMQKHSAILLTAHQADDLAETLVWRIFTGASATHGAGILSRFGEEFRPCLEIRKAALLSYLKEEKQAWREDATNHEGRLLRSKMRISLMPAIEELFPQAVRHLVKIARDIDKSTREPTFDRTVAVSPAVLFSAAGIIPRKAHLAWLEGRNLDPKWTGEIHLPGGWTLKKEKKTQRGAEKWVLEK